MEYGNYIEIKQQQSLSLGQMQSLAVLAMTNQELCGFLSNEYLENPMLEHVEIRSDGAACGMGGFGGGAREDRPFGFDLPAQPEHQLEMELFSQLDLQRFSRRQLRVMRYLIQCLDERGYFTFDLEELSAASGFAPEELAEALQLLKGLEPAGIFSRDLSECLLRQLPEREKADPVLTELIRTGLPDLLNGRIGKAAEALQVPAAQVRRYLSVIGALNPYPLRGLPGPRTSYIVPDIIVTRDGADWNVALNDRWMGEYRCSGYYLRMMDTAADAELAEYFQKKLKRARFVLSCVEQRRATLVGIVEAVLRRQRDYFEGTGPLKPMGQEEVAEALGLHVSTVSRAVKGKYIQYKRTELLKDLFTRALPQESGDISAEAVKKRIRQLIDGEGRKPLSDQKLAGLLAGEGLAVSRRAVAKYRAQMDIPDSRLRNLR